MDTWLCKQLGPKIQKETKHMADYDVDNCLKSQAKQLENTSVFRRRGSQVARATRSYDRLHRFSGIVLCNIHHPVLFNAIRRRAFP